MQLGLLLEKYQVQKPKSSITNRRQEIVKEFVDEINKERMGTKWKPVTGRSVALKIAHLSEPDMYYFLSQCRDYKNRHHSFSKCFYGSLKTKLA